MMTPDTGDGDGGEDLRARDLLPELSEREPAGAGLSRRVGSRGWDRAPVVGCSRRIFDRCAIADPWKPDSEDAPLGLGPVSLKFEERRQPAPHADVRPPPRPREPWEVEGGPAQSAAPRPKVPERPPAPGPSEAPSPPPPRQAEPQPPSRSPSPPPATVRSGTGRFRLKPTPTSGVRKRAIPAPATTPPTEEPSPKQEQSPPAAEPRPPIADSLDDLFQMPMGEGRDRRVGAPRRAGAGKGEKEG